ncbi:sensor histidine kinase [Paenibacillus sp. GCM10027626]|uniref:sensor histidine kinase n=1 Tax=Paenibacillus sp. GCM10027626 TaxID=3273411 RepID=UPI0036262B8D
MVPFKRLQTKILLSFLLLVLIPLLGLGASSYLISTGLVQQQTEQNQEQTIRLVADIIRQTLNDAQDISSFIMTNETIQMLLGDASAASPDSSAVSASSAANRQKMIMEYLSNLKLAKKYLSFIIIYGENDFLYRDFANYYRQVVPYQEFQNDPLYIATASRDGQALLSSSSAPLFIHPRSYDEVTMGRRIINNYDPEDKLGMLFLGINRQFLASIIQDVKISQTTNLLLFDDNYKLIASKLEDKRMNNLWESNIKETRRLLEQGDSSIFTTSDDSYLSASTVIDGYGWHVVSLTPLQDIEKQYSIVLRITLLLTVSLLLVVMLISFLLSRSITLPIKKLLRSMSHFRHGNIKQEVPVESRDEIGLLTHKYNEMITELNDMIQKVYITQTNQKIIELKTLQTQIEPHFLYNTLDYIFFNSKINGDDETAQVVRSLSELFRLSLNKGNDYYPLAQEFVQIKAYIRIQHARFPNRFRPEYDIDPAVEPCYTMKLLLQPIVENAIVHAFDGSAEQPGLLRITARQMEEQIVLYVQDNGRGMSAAQVSSLLQVSSRSQGGYGVRNVNERLQMLLGPEYGLHIESAPGEGTLIIMRLPIVRSEEEWRSRYENYGH